MRSIPAEKMSVQVKSHIIMPLAFSFLCKSMPPPLNAISMLPLTMLMMEQQVKISMLYFSDSLSLAHTFASHVRRNLAMMSPTYTYCHYHISYHLLQLTGFSHIHFQAWLFPPDPSSPGKGLGSDDPQHAIPMANKSTN